MTVKFSAAKTLAVLLSAVAVLAVSLAASPADAQTQRKARVYISKRSWLDAGVEVLPGDRKFTDYAFPQGQTFARGNQNRPLDRQPLNPASDFGYGDDYQTRGFPIPSLF